MKPQNCFIKDFNACGGKFKGINIRFGSLLHEQMKTFLDKQVSLLLTLQYLID